MVSEDDGCQVHVSSVLVDTIVVANARKAVFVDLNVDGGVSVESVLVDAVVALGTEIDMV